MHLSPKAFELLNVLIAARPRVLSKHDLHSRLWSGVFVTDDALTKVVREIRAALGDSPHDPRFIRTVHGVGYAFSELSIDASGGLGQGQALPCWLIWEGREVRLAPGENIVGRDPDVQVALDVRRVSRRHARVVVAGERVEFEDLGSTNGIFVRNQRIDRPTRLEHGHEIRVGPVTLVFRQAEAPAPTEAEPG